MHLIMNVPTVDFPSIPTPPGFHLIVRPGDTPEPVSSPLMFDSLPELPGWYPATHTMDVRDGPTLSSPISPIACVSPGVSAICMTSSSSVVSDGDAGLLAALLGPPSFRLPQQKTGSPELSSSSAMDVPASRIQRGSLRPVPRWRQTREGPFLSEISPSDAAGFGHGCAFRSTMYRSTDYAQPSGKYGLPLHHPRFLEWIGTPKSAGSGP